MKHKILLSIVVSYQHPDRCDRNCQGLQGRYNSNYCTLFDTELKQTGNKQGNKACFRCDRCKESDVTEPEEAKV